jgi:alpha,alpha-trehalose phosphorylase
MSRPDPWCITEDTVPHDSLRQAESIFALSNGHIGLRGTLDEPEPCGMPGTYLNSLYEERDLTYPESGYAFPDSSQTIVDAPNGKLLTLTVDGEPLDVRTGTVLLHTRRLDLRAGTLHRDVEWESPGGSAVRVRSTRLVSFPRPSTAVIRYEVEALDRTVRVRVDSDLLANAEQTEQRDDPRAATVLHQPFAAVQQSSAPDGGILVHRTKRSGIGVASAVAHRVSAPGAVRTVVGADRVRTTITADLAPGDTLRIDKVLAYAWDGHRTPDTLSEAARADRDAAARAGWDALVAEQRTYLDDFWDAADVELDGDPEVQQAVRFGLFHVLQAGAQAGPHPIAAKGLTGNGYDGHVLWDTESFVLPVLTYTHPGCVAEALRWRHATLGAARDRAQELRLAGAAFPWRTIGGQECSGYWPAGTAALHLNADIADAVLRYAAATGDHAFMRDAGLELLVETARLWHRVAHADDDGTTFHIDGVTGPDEYSALTDDNLFTNLMAQHNLLGAVEAAGRYPADARRLGVGADELAGWRAVAQGLHLPYDERRRVHQQSAGFTRLQEWDFAGTSTDEYPLLMHYPYLELYRRQVIKQADVVLAMHLRGDAFTDDDKARNFAYYEARTVRDSSLSSSCQAVLAAELGHLELAHDHLAESALQDLDSPGEKSGDGLHIAACAGAWTALVMGFGGLRDHHGRLTFAPRLPSHLPRLRFSVRWHGALIRVTVAGPDVTYEVTGGEADVHHHGQPVSLAPGRPVTLAVPPLDDPGPQPASPPGRAPQNRRKVLDG